MHGGGGGGFSGGHHGGGFGGHSHTSSSSHHHHGGYQAANDAFLYNNLGQYRQRDLYRRGSRRQRGNVVSVVFSLLFFAAVLAIVIMNAH
ncbi:MAG TPA: hypothetical protein VG317_04310 [Pseudonocardiaceae bacterium]|jgi:hypothetical protein|nr:hypothetical protein [Pseudonocardiaceae bacterium]